MPVSFGGRGGPGGGDGIVEISTEDASATTVGKVVVHPSQYTASLTTETMVEEVLADATWTAVSTGAAIFDAIFRGRHRGDPVPAAATFTAVADGASLWGRGFRGEHTSDPVNPTPATGTWRAFDDLATLWDRRFYGEHASAPAAPSARTGGYSWDVVADDGSVSLWENRGGGGFRGDWYGVRSTRPGGQVAFDIYYDDGTGSNAEGFWRRSSDGSSWAVYDMASEAQFLGVYPGRVTADAGAADRYSSTRRYALWGGELRIAVPHADLDWHPWATGTLLPFTPASGDAFRWQGVHATAPNAPQSGRHVYWDSANEQFQQIDHTLPTPLTAWGNVPNFATLGFGTIAHSDNRFRGLVDDADAADALTGPSWDHDWVIYGNRLRRLQGPIYWSTSGDTWNIYRGETWGTISGDDIDNDGGPWLGAFNNQAAAEADSDFQRFAVAVWSDQVRSARTYTARVWTTHFEVVAEGTVIPTNPAGGPYTWQGVHATDPNTPTSGKHVYYNSAASEWRRVNFDSNPQVTTWTVFAGSGPAEVGWGSTNRFRGVLANQAAAYATGSPRWNQDWAIFDGELRRLTSLLYYNTGSNQWREFTGSWATVSGTTLDNDYPNSQWRGSHGSRNNTIRVLRQNGDVAEYDNVVRVVSAFAWLHGWYWNFTDDVWKRHTSSANGSWITYNGDPSGGNDTWIGEFADEAAADASDDAQDGAIAHFGATIRRASSYTPHAPAHILYAFQALVAGTPQTNNAFTTALQTKLNALRIINLTSMSLSGTTLTLTFQRYNASGVEETATVTQDLSGLGGGSGITTQADVPQNSEGSNGDYIVVTGTTNPGLYHKAAGSWSRVITSGGAPTAANIYTALGSASAISSTDLLAESDEVDFILRDTTSTAAMREISMDGLLAALDIPDITVQTAVPQNSQGSDGEFVVVTGNTTPGLYHKASGSWSNILAPSTSSGGTDVTAAAIYTAMVGTGSDDYGESDLNSSVGIYGYEGDGSSHSTGTSGSVRFTVDDLGDYLRILSSQADVPQNTEGTNGDFIVVTGATNPGLYHKASGSWSRILQAGSGTSVEANPSAASTDTLTKLSVDGTVYAVPSGGGAGVTLVSTVPQAGDGDDGDMRLVRGVDAIQDGLYHKASGAWSQVMAAPATAGGLLTEYTTVYNTESATMTTGTMVALGGDLRSGTTSSRPRVVNADLSTDGTGAVRALAAPFGIVVAGNTGIASGAEGLVLTRGVYNKVLGSLPTSVPSALRSWSKDNTVYAVRNISGESYGNYYVYRRHLEAPGYQLGVILALGENAQGNPIQGGAHEIYWAFPSRELLYPGVYSAPFGLPVGRDEMGFLDVPAGATTERPMRKANMRQIARAGVECVNVTGNSLASDDIVVESYDFDASVDATLRPARSHARVDDDLTSESRPMGILNAGIGNTASGVLLEHGVKDRALTSFHAGSAPAWGSGRSYVKGNVASHSGEFYQCERTHTSTATGEEGPPGSIATTAWLPANDTPIPIWDDGISFTSGGFCEVSGDYYLCIRSHTSAVGDVANGSPVQPLATAWREVLITYLFDVPPAWGSSRSYAQGARVEYSGRYYEAIRAHTSSSSSSSVNGRPDRAASTAWSPRDTTTATETPLATVPFGLGAPVYLVWHNDEAVFKIRPDPEDGCWCVGHVVRMPTKSRQDWDVDWDFRNLAPFRLPRRLPKDPNGQALGAPLIVGEENGERTIDYGSPNNLVPLTLQTGEAPIRQNDGTLAGGAPWVTEVTNEGPLWFTITLDEGDNSDREALVAFQSTTEGLAALETITTTAVQSNIDNVVLEEMAPAGVTGLHGELWKDTRTTNQKDSGHAEYIADPVWAYESESNVLWGPQADERDTNAQHMVLHVVSGNNTRRINVVYLQNNTVNFDTQDEQSPTASTLSNSYQIRIWPNGVFTTGGSAGNQGGTSGNGGGTTGQNPVAPFHRAVLYSDATQAPTKPTTATIWNGSEITGVPTGWSTDKSGARWITWSEMHFTGGVWVATSWLTPLLLPTADGVFRRYGVGPYHSITWHDSAPSHVDWDQYRLPDGTWGDPIPRGPHAILGGRVLFEEDFSPLTNSASVFSVDLGENVPLTRYSEFRLRHRWKTASGTYDSGTFTPWTPFMASVGNVLNLHNEVQGATWYVRMDAQTGGSLDLKLLTSLNDGDRGNIQKCKMNFRRTTGGSAHEFRYVDMFDWGSDGNQEWQMVVR